MPNVFLNDTAFARLKSVKKEGQSFSEVIIDKIPQEIDWDRFSGILKGADSEKILRELQEERRRS